MRGEMVHGSSVQGDVRLTDTYRACWVCLLATIQTSMHLGIPRQNLQWILDPRHRGDRCAQDAWGLVHGSLMKHFSAHEPHALWKKRASKPPALAAVVVTCDASCPPPNKICA